MAERESYELREPGRDPAEKIHWFDELVKRGLTVAQVEKLVDRRDVSLHDLIELLEQGCPPEVAFDIMF